MNYDMTAAENIGLGDLSALDDRARLAGAATRGHRTTGSPPCPAATTRRSPGSSRSARRTTPTGVVLSGGQWQRLALARSLVREGRDLMILDEPSSGLDPEAEHEVHARISRAPAGPDEPADLAPAERGARRRPHRGARRRPGHRAGLPRRAARRGGGYARLFRLQADGYQEAL